jgi:hypothetical protein
MDDCEIDFVERVIRHISTKKGSINVFEWGSGYSTMYFPDACLGPNCTWTAIENRTSWCVEVESKEDRRVEVIRFGEVDPGYYLVARMRTDIDLWIIDGHKRPECHEMIRERSGIILLHDCFEPGYERIVDQWAGRVHGRVWTMMAFSNDEGINRELSDIAAAVPRGPLKYLDMDGHDYIKNHWLSKISDR